MQRSVPDQGGRFGLRNSLVKLYADLQSSAVDGVVPAQVFRDAADTLGLDKDARTRLAAELGRLNLRVAADRIKRTAVVEDPPAHEMVALSPVEHAHRLLGRFADREGKVTPRALDGVIRLAGLSALAARELRGSVRLVQPGTPAGAAEPLETAGEDRFDPASPPQDLDPESSRAGRDLTAAVAAAMAVIAEDRFTRRPSKRILTAEEEVGLSVLLRGGVDKARTEPGKEELAQLPPGDVRRLARECLVLHNQGLAHAVAQHTSSEQGLEYEDIVQHGILGVIRAARGFDPLKGYKFSTYATWWVRQSITRAIANEGRLIRIPVHMYELAQKVARVERELAAQGRPTRAVDVAVACDIQVTKVEEIRRLTQRTDSLDRVIGDGTHLGELVEARTALPGVEAAVLAALAEQGVDDLIRLLPERYAQIVNRRFGVDGQEPATLDVIGKEIGVTRERIRQLEARVLPLLTLAYRDPAGDPYTALRQMLNDPWLGPDPTNPVNMIAKDLRDRTWLEAIQALAAFREQTGGSWPAAEDNQGSFPIGRWVVEQRRLGRAGGTGLPAHRRIALDALGMVWEQAAPLSPLPVDRSQVRVRVPSLPPRTMPAPRRAPAAAGEPGHGPVPESVDPARTVSTPEADRHDQHSTIGHQEQVGPPPAPAAPLGISVPVPTPRSQAPVSPEIPLLDESGEARGGDWEEARNLVPPLDRNIRWAARYVLLALGTDLVDRIMGAHNATTVAETADGRRLPERPVAMALTSLARALDALKGANLRPEQFLEASSPALLGQSPLVYFARFPLVKPEPRFALSDALRAFLDAEQAQPSV